MNQTRLLWRRVCQGFYVKTIMLQLQQPTPGYNTDSLTLTCLPQWKHSNHTLQLLYLYSKRTKQKITIFVPRAISLCELCKQTKFFFFRDVITFYSQIQPYFVKIWGGDLQLLLSSLNLCDLGNIKVSLFCSKEKENPDCCILNELYWTKVTSNWGKNMNRDAAMRCTESMKVLI